MLKSTDPVTLRLYEVMHKHGLSRLDVALLIGVSIDTVNSWLAPETAAKHRDMPGRHLSHLLLAVNQSR
jgi:hypothetical protein